MRQIFPPKKIYLSDSKVADSDSGEFKAGQGVFASEEIKKGEVIEVAPILILDFSDFIDTKWNLLFEYYFWLDDYVVLALGFGGMYNHSKNSNANYQIDKDNQTITFTATQDIKKDDEIYFNYKGTSSERAPLWFER